MIGRRGFITGLVSLVAAPAIVRAGSLMPVKVMVGVDGLSHLFGQSVRVALEFNRRRERFLELITVPDLTAIEERIENMIRCHRAASTVGSWPRNVFANVPGQLTQGDDR